MRIMARRLPPLNALRAFEAAARHLSFTRAADELSVTQAAVSHQVKALEDWLGRPLFRRLNRAVELTEAGRRLLAPVTAGLDQIADGVARAAAGDGDGRVLTVSTLPSFAARWLILRLPRFHERHPGIDVRLHTDNALVDFERMGVDVAVRFGRGGWPRLAAERLVSVRVFPVCSPRLMEGPHPLRTPSDLRHHTLLHDDFEVDGREIGWTEWLRVAGAGDVDASRGPWFTDSGMVMQLAAEGRGVALARTLLADDELRSGRLVRPFAQEIPMEHAYWIAAPPERMGRPKVRAFRDWLTAEIEAGRAAA
jgi:LysR family glycine cleavage system transcriptional activator